MRPPQAAQVSAYFAGRPRPIRKPRRHQRDGPPCQTGCKPHKSSRRRNSGYEHPIDVLVGPHRRQGSDAWPLPRFAVVLDDHLRQEPPLPQVPRRDGEFRAGVLVRPVAGGALRVAGEPAQHRRGGAVRRRHARVETFLPAGGRLLPRPACAHRQGARRLDRARGRTARVESASFWPPWPRPGRSSAFSAPCSAS